MAGWVWDVRAVVGGVRRWRRRWRRWGRPLAVALGRATLILAPTATRDLAAADQRYRRHRALTRTRPGR